MRAANAQGIRILAVDPVGPRGHRNFDTFFLRVLKRLGHVTFVAPQGYLDTIQADARIDLPFRCRGRRGRVSGRWTQVMALRHIQKRLALEAYDVIVFLAYETLSFCLAWSRKWRVCLFEHNNIENAYRSKIKSLFYRYLPSSTSHFVFQQHVGDYIRDRTRRSAKSIPFPYYRTDVTSSGEEIARSSIFRVREPVIVFSPSSSTPLSIQRQLRSFASKNMGRYFAVFKDTVACRTGAWESRPFFCDYEERLRSCDFVFVGSRFEYRVSNVAYESLSYGRPTIMFASSFSEALRKEYPHLVFLIQVVEDILGLKLNSERMLEEHGIFLRRHSFASVLEAVRLAAGLEGLER
jgi:hypothetical protein